MPPTQNAVNEALAEKKRILRQKQQQWMRERYYSKMGQSVNETLESSGLNSLSSPERPAAASSARQPPAAIASSSPQRRPTEKDTQNDRYLYEAALHSKPSDPTPLVYNDTMVVLIAEKMEQVMRSQIRAELEKESSLKALKTQMVNERLDKFLASEIDSHTCDVCYEPMVPPRKAPIILYPCGHSFCQSCITQHLDKSPKKTCPSCRAQIVSQAPNIPLQQIILSFIEKKKTVENSMAQDQQAGPSMTSSTTSLPRLSTARSSFSTSSSENKEDDLYHYTKEYNRYRVRVQILQNDLRDCQLESRELDKEEDKLQNELLYFEDQETTVSEQITRLMQQLEQIHENIQSRRERKELVGQRKAECAKRSELTGTTLAQVTAQLKKAKLFIQNIDPNASIEDDDFG